MHTRGTISYQSTSVLNCVNCFNYEFRDKSSFLRIYLYYENWSYQGLALNIPTAK